MNFENGNVPARQHHRVVLIENLVSVVRVVFRRYRQEHTFALQVKQMVLEIAVGLTWEFVAKLDALKSVLPDDPAPERVV